MTRASICFGLSLAMGLPFASTLAAQDATKTLPVLVAAGCLQEDARGWLLTGATDAVAAAQMPADKASGASGKNRYRLIGVSEFNLPVLKGRRVIVKGLFVPAGSETRLNLTSAQDLGTPCAPAK